MQQCAIIITQYKKYYICKFKLLKNDKFCNNPLKPHCSAPCIEPHHQFIPLWGAEGITDATGATCSPHWGTGFLPFIAALREGLFVTHFVLEASQKCRH